MFQNLLSRAAVLLFIGKTHVLKPNVGSLPNALLFFRFPHFIRAISAIFLRFHRQIRCFLRYFFRKIHISPVIVRSIAGGFQIAHLIQHPGNKAGEACHCPKIQYKIADADLPRRHTVDQISIGCQIPHQVNESIHDMLPIMQFLIGHFICLHLPDGPVPDAAQPGMHPKDSHIFGRRHITHGRKDIIPVPAVLGLPLPHGFLKAQPFLDYQHIQQR